MVRLVHTNGVSGVSVVQVCGRVLGLRRRTVADTAGLGGEAFQALECKARDAQAASAHIAKGTVTLWSYTAAVDSLRTSDP
jgi:hypothetical protein